MNPDEAIKQMRKLATQLTDLQAAHADALATGDDGKWRRVQWMEDELRAANITPILAAMEQAKARLDSAEKVVELSRELVNRLEAVCAPKGWDYYTLELRTALAQHDASKEADET